MSINPGLGPQPVRQQSVSFATPPGGLGADRVLSALRSRRDPASILQLEHELGLHANTIRLALQTLRRAGLAARAAASAHGRGRPAHLYAATAQARLAATDGSPLDDYHGLTAALVAHLSESADAAVQGRAVGRHWGRRMVDDPPPRSAGPAGGGREGRSPRQVIIDLLEGLGFSPTTDDAGIALHTCPLLALARRNPDVVCQIHAGMIDGAQERLGPSGAPADLRPFAETGACRLRLGDPPGG